MVLAFLGLAASALANASDSPRRIALRGVAPASVASHAKYEIAFDIEAEYSNPFDPAEVEVRAVFVSASGRRVAVPAFWFQDFERSVLAGDTPTTKPYAAHWMVRFAPTEPGEYTGTVEVIEGRTRSALPLPPFRCTRSTSPGFVRATRGSAARTVFESGQSFVPIGECLWMPRSLAQFDDELRRYERHGLNYFRFFTSHDSMFFFESARQPAGRYDLLLLRRLDRLFEAVEERGVYLMPCLEMFADFRVTPPYPYWNDNAYNARNGGPCATVSEFFTHPEARRLYRNKLRYFVARYGYSTALFCIQLFAEANYIENYNADAVRAWHREMAAYVHSIDPYGHLVSTSMAAWDSQDRKLFALPDLDIVLNEVYNANDFAAKLAYDNAQILRTYGKPVFVAELGITFEYITATDPNGIHIHNAAWASALSGGAGAPSFWWTSYIRQHDLLPHLGAFSAFVRGENLARLRPVSARVTAGTGPPIHPDLILAMPYQDPPEARGPQTLRLSNRKHADREIRGLPRNLHGAVDRNGRPNPGHNPLTLETDFAADGAITVQPRWLAGTEADEARLHIYVDDVLAKVIRYNGCSMDNWQAFLKRSREVCVPTSVPVPKGRHRIRLDNRGNLFVNASIELSNYVVSSASNLRVIGLGDSRRALLWLQNRDNTWWRNEQGKRPREVAGSRVTLARMDAGAYEIEWWDTYRGVATRRERTETQGGSLVLAVEPLATDVACKVRRVGPGGS